VILFALTLPISSRAEWAVLSGRLWLVYWLIGAVTISFLGAWSPWRRRTGCHPDDRLRPDPFGALLAGAGITLALVAIMRDLAVDGPTVFLWGQKYVAVLALFAGLAYAEDVVNTPVRLHLLRPTWPAWAGSGLTLIAVATTVFWMISAVRSGQSFLPSALFALLVLTLVFLCGTGVALCLARSSGTDQQLTAKSASHNVWQGAGLYFVMIALTCWLPQVLHPWWARGGLSSTAVVNGVCSATTLAGALWVLGRALISQQLSCLSSAVPYRRTGGSYERLDQQET
jgi:hypothetical protein